MKARVLFFILVGVITCNMLPAHASAQIITTIAGCGIGDDSLATHAELIGPVGVTRDSAGNTYVAEQANYRVRMINTAGVINTVAGNGVFGNSGDGGPATAANVGVLYGIAKDKVGNIYVVDNYFNCIRKINPSGIISTVAGTGSPIGGYSGDGGPAAAAQLNAPIDIVVDTSGNIIFTDWQNNVVREVNTAGIISTIVGDGHIGTIGNGGPATASELGSPFRVTMDRFGNLYVAEVIFQCICKVDTASIITIIGGTGAYAIGTDGDGGPATDATMTSPCGMAADTFGNLFFSDIGNGRIRKIDMNTGIISNYAANGVAGYSGDDGPAVAGQISTPEGLACDISGNLYICDADNNRIREVSTAGTLTTFAGQNGLFEDGNTAVNSELCITENITTDAAGNIYVADIYNNRIRMVDAATGIMTTVAGSGIAGYGDAFSGDGGPALAAHIYNPVAVAVDLAGNIYVCDQGNSRIRKVNTSGIISTIAGQGTAGFSGDGGPAVLANLNDPAGIAVDAAGNVYIADEGNNRVRKVTPAGIISTIAGDGVASHSGDNGPATLAKLHYPTDVSLDGVGNLYICDAGNSVIRKVDALGIITNVAGNDTAGYTGDGIPATSAELAYPNAIKADSAGNIYIADNDNERIRIVNTEGIINTVAGNGYIGFSGDGGPAVLATLNTPAGVAVDKVGNLFISDAFNHRIRKTSLTLSVPAINNSGLENVLVYPNPATGRVTIAHAANCEVILYDILGKENIKSTISGNKETMDVSSLANGIYIIQLTNSNGEKKMVKLVKE